MASATIQLTITDNANVTIVQVANALCTAWGRPDLIGNVAAQEAFIKTQMLNWFQNEYINASASQASQAAYTSAQTTAQQISLS